MSDGGVILKERNNHIDLFRNKYYCHSLYKTTTTTTTVLQIMMATYKFGSIIEAALVEMALSIVRHVNTRQPSISSHVECVVRRVNQNLRHVLPPNQILSTGRQTGNKREATIKIKTSHRVGPEEREGLLTQRKTWCSDKVCMLCAVCAICWASPCRRQLA